MNNRTGILVVDDTIESLKLLTEVLREAGHLVRPAAGGEQALTAVAAQPPELVLLDVRMPGMDGMEVCRRLKAQESWRDIPVLFLSASTNTEERVQGLEMGGVDFIGKPFDRAELLARVQTHLELSRLRTGLEGMVRERTEMYVQINEQLKTSLAEKQVLLQETHHRVKNNLQLVSSLLSLQAAHTKNQDAISVLESTRGRVRSMALLHEALYHSENISRVSFKKYAENLCQYLWSAFEPQARAIEPVLSLLDVELDLDKTVTCGLIVNELVTNAFKHGYPDGRKGKIKIALERLHPGLMRLTVQDDGVGLPADKSVDEPETLGLQLVGLLSNKLLGTVSFSAPPGLTTIIDFPFEEARP